MNAVFSSFFMRSGRFRHGGTFALFAAAFLFGLFDAVHPAIAAAAAAPKTTLGDVFCNAANNLSPFIDIFNMVAYTAGAFIVVQGLLHLRHHHDNPTQHPHHKTFAMFLAGSCLTALPAVMGTLIDTLFGLGGSGSTGGLSGVNACNGASASAPVAAQTLDAIMTNLITNIQTPLTFLVSIVAITLGVFLILRGLMKGAKYGTDPRTHSITFIISNLLIGTALVVIGENIDVLTASIIGQDISSGGVQKFETMSWTSLNSLGGDLTHFKAAMKAALTFFQLVGLISFVRGWNVIRNAVEGVAQATMAQGLTHIIGGVLAINIYSFMTLMDHTFGTAFVS